MGELQSRGDLFPHLYIHPPLQALLSLCGIRKDLEDTLIQVKTILNYLDVRVVIS